METQLWAGFARTDITPVTGNIPLAGYGAVQFRIAARTLDQLRCHAVALGNGSKPEAVTMTADLVNMPEELYKNCAAAVAEKLGIPAERVMIGGTHTHSGPSIDSVEFDSIKAYRELLVTRLAEVAVRAAADMKPAKISYGSMEVGHEGGRLNFTRHYLMAKIEDKDKADREVHEVGDNFGDIYASDRAHYCYVAHTEEADHTMQLVRFEREGADDIVLINFQAHATVTGGFNKLNMSADFPGAIVTQAEKLIPGIKCVYLQGACGNLNWKSRMVEETIPGITMDFHSDVTAYSTALAYHVQLILEKHMQASGKGGFDVIHDEPVYTYDHADDSRVEDAKLCREQHEKYGRTPEVTAFCRKMGFNSVYHAAAAIRKATAPAGNSFRMNALRFGDCAMITAPVEMFNATGMDIKARSPFAQTLVKGYSCGSRSYLPNAASPKECYERNVCVFASGVAEQAADHYVELLQELKKREQ